jgi:RecT family protein
MSLTEIKPDADYGLPAVRMAPGLALLFNDKLYERCKQVATIMSGAKGFTPPHLIGSSEACFGVVQMALTWGLTPQLVAASTYATPGGKIGYEGKLVQGILENSGWVEGSIQYQMVGDWNKVRGKFKKMTSQKGGEYHVPDWKEEDEEGLGVIVRAKVRGEEQPREMEPLMLRSCWPRLSTQWALQPELQIKYRACRQFANTVAPGIFMGVPFDAAEELSTMRDITPARPVRDEFEAPKQAASLIDPKQAPTHNEETGEITGEDPRPEVSVADAFERGRQDRDAKKALRAVPPEWREPGEEPFAEAWQAGWRARDAEIATEAREKK